MENDAMSRRLDNVGWNRDNLNRHYNRHPNGKDRECWADLTKQPAPISLARYRTESINAWLRGFLEISYINHRKDHTGKPHDDRCVSRVDQRGVRVVVSDRAAKIVTCYHLHNPIYGHQPAQEMYREQLIEIFRTQLRRARSAKRESGHNPTIEELRWA